MRAHAGEVERGLELPRTRGILRPIGGNSETHAKNDFAWSRGIMRPIAREPNAKPTCLSRAKHAKFAK